jgi:heme-degrading monooxygenase HmoA
MLKRLVKLTFRPEEVTYFIGDIFENSKAQIRAFPGCNHMELLQNESQQNVLFTLSIWASKADLEAYRHSDLFRATWAKTKVLFAEKPEAWSTIIIDSGQSKTDIF